MKTTIKKNLIIFHNLREFEELHHRLFEEYGKSTMMISWKTKRELGFTIRRHKGLVSYMDKYGYNVMKDAGLHLVDEMAQAFIEENKHKKAYEDQVHLDFYNEAQMSWFVLKYLNN